VLNVNLHPFLSCNNRKSFKKYIAEKKQTFFPFIVSCQYQTQQMLGYALLTQPRALPHRSRVKRK